MSDRMRPSLFSRRAVWTTAISFWLFVAAISAAQVLWIARTPGQRIDVRGAIVWQTTYFVAWIPFTVAVWHVTAGWVPERFGGWLRLLLAHLPLSAAVVLTHTVVVALFGMARADQSAP